MIIIIRVLNDSDNTNNTNNNNNKSNVAALEAPTIQKCHGTSQSSKNMTGTRKLHNILQTPKTNTHTHTHTHTHTPSGIVACVS